MIVNFKLGRNTMIKIYYSVSDTSYLEKEFRVLPTGVKPLTFRILVRRFVEASLGHITRLNK